MKTMLTRRNIKNAKSLGGAGSASSLLAIKPLSTTYGDQNSKDKESSSRHQSMSSQRLTQILLLLNVTVVSISLWSFLNAAGSSLTQNKVQEELSFAPPDTTTSNLEPVEDDVSPHSAAEDSALDILSPSVDNHEITQTLRNREMGGSVKEQNFIDGIFVISLQGTANSDPHNEGRLNSFKEAWRKSCGSLEPGMRVCPGVVDERRGYGLTRSWLDCLQMAREMNLNVTMIFEDDARLFDRESALDFCDKGKRQSKVWGNLPEDTFIAFLGGHTWTYDQETDSSLQPSKFRPASFSYGTYGFAVPHQSLDTLLETIKGDIAHGFVDENGVRHTEFLSPEKSWYGKARDVGKKVYAINPLAVWHQGGFSNTWKVNRESITGEEEDDDGDYDVGGIRGVSAG